MKRIYNNEQTRNHIPKQSYKLTIEGVQTEVDAGYEGQKQLVLIEAKNIITENVIIRQLYFPFRQWQLHTKKKVVTLFFSKSKNLYSIWKFEFDDPTNYNSIVLKESAKFIIENNI